MTWKQGKQDFDFRINEKEDINAIKRQKGPPLESRRQGIRVPCITHTHRHTRRPDLQVTAARTPVDQRRTPGALRRRSSAQESIPSTSLLPFFPRKICCTHSLSRHHRCSSFFIEARLPKREKLQNRERKRVFCCAKAAHLREAS